MTDTLLPERDENFDGVPFVGCGVTIPSGSDCSPGTVVRVSERTYRTTIQSTGYPPRAPRTVEMPARIWVRGCSYRPTKNYSYTGNQEHEFIDDGFEGTLQEYSWRPKRQRYVRVGTPTRSTAAQGLGLGFRRAYRDPHF